MKTTVGVDIGASGVRVAEVLGLDSNGYALVRKHAFVPLSPGVIIADKISRPNIVAAALQSAMKQAGIVRKPIVLGLTSRQSAIAYDLAPIGLSRSDRESIIRNNSREISSSVSLAQGSISTSVVGTTQQGDGTLMSQMLVGVAAAEEVRQLMQIAKLARIQVQAVDLSGMATLRAYLRPTPDSSNCLALVDIGSIYTTVVVADGPYIRSIRTLAGGGSNITRALQSTDSTLTREELEEKKANYTLRSFSSFTSDSVFGSYMADTDGELQGNLGHATVDEAVERVVGDLVNQIRDVLDAEAALKPLDKVQSIVLAGRGSLLGGLKEFIASTIGLPTSIRRPIAKIQGYSDDDEEDLVIGMGTAIGLGLWENPA